MDMTPRTWAWAFTDSPASFGVGRLRKETEAQRAERKAQNDREIFELGKVLETFEIRFTRDGKIVTLDPNQEGTFYRLMGRNHLKLLLKERYLNAGFTKRGKELDRFLDFFIDACKSWGQVAEQHGDKPIFVNVVEERIQ